MLCSQSHFGSRVHQQRAEFPYHFFHLRVAGPQLLGLGFAGRQKIPQFPVLAENVPGCFQPVQYRAQFIFGDRFSGGGWGGGPGLFRRPVFLPH